MSYWILPESGIPISCITVQQLMFLEKQTDEWKNRMEAYFRGLDDKLNAISTTIGQRNLPNSNSNILDLDQEDKTFLDKYNQVIDNKDIAEADDSLGSSNKDGESYLNMRLGIHKGGEEAMVMATVKKRALDKDGQVMGKYHENPLMDSRLYEIEYSDGTYDTMSANIITENLLMQVNDQG